MKLGLASTVFVGVIAAAGAARASAPPALAKAGNQQAALAVGYDDKGSLRAALCGAGPCSVAGGVELQLPPAYAGRKGQTKFQVVPLELNRRAIVVTVPGARPETAWQAVVSAPLGAGPPRVHFAGETGWVSGVEGERRGPRVEVRNDHGTWRILVGEQWEDLTLCGREAILSPRVLDPKTLKLVGAKVQRLGREEVEQATELSVETLPEATQAGPPLFRHAKATSALGDPGAISDGNLETVWSENVGGGGRGEFVRVDVPGDLPIEGLELVFRPPSGGPAKGAAPKELWLVSAKRVYKVAIPDNGWRPGARYGVKFDVPLVGDCLALVLDSTLDPSAEAQVTVAEVTARTQFGNADEKALVAALSGGGERAQNARRILQTRGRPAHEAVAAVFEDLDEGGRREALEVIDAAGCDIAVPVYMKAVVGPFESQRTHARSRLRRCGAPAAQALSAALPEAKGAALQELASELALIDPAQAVRAIVPLLEEEQVARRRVLRVALGRAASSPRSRDALSAVLADTTLGETALLDVLRALGPRLAGFGDAAARALARLAAPGQSFRVRYLRTTPAAALAAHDAGAQRLLSTAITDDPQAHVRAQAARVVTAPELFKSELTRALSDSEVRVREAAARALARPSGAFATGALVERLSDDRWPMVRSAAALALAEFAPDAKVDEHLGEALDDSAWVVRRDAAVALGRRSARSQAEPLRERLDDRDERFEVRVAAARALGEVCDRDSAKVLARYAERLSDPMAPNELRSVAYAALGSLARLGVPDLRSRLEPLLAPEAPAGARAAAQAALASKPACR